MVKRTCELCGVEFLIPPSVVAKGKGRFCTRECVKKAKADRLQPTPIEIVFEKHVDRSAGPEACWPWTGSKDRKGYGRIMGNTGRKTVAAHRYAFFIANGMWPLKHVLHSCNNPPCCNPKHLRDGDNRENYEDSRLAGTNPHGEKHPQHKLTAANVREVRAMIATGINQTEIGRRFGVHQVTIWDIVHGRTWRHLA